MSNSYFQFKQFRVDQGDCAMKVSTEACLFGAWIPTDGARRILDIGTGTGLLSLMLAQRSDAHVDAVELDELAANQAGDNFVKSNWSNRLNIFHQEIGSFVKGASHTYDLIVSNPPFFKGSLKSEYEPRNLALHQSSGLDSKALVQVIDKLLTLDGRAYVLYPIHEANLFSVECSRAGLSAQVAMTMYNQPHKNVFRAIIRVSHEEAMWRPEVVSIRQGEHYSKEFVQLLQPYYLHL